MARPPRNEMAAKELGMRLTELHQAAGSPPMRQIDRFITRQGPDIAEESIRKAHAGLIDPGKCDAELLAGLARFYRVDFDALGRHAAERMRTLWFLMPSPVGGPSGGSEQGITGTGCIPDAGKTLAPVLPFRVAS